MPHENIFFFLPFLTFCRIRVAHIVDVVALVASFVHLVVLVAGEAVLEAAEELFEEAAAKVFLEAEAAAFILFARISVPIRAL